MNSETMGDMHMEPRHGDGPETDVDFDHFSPMTARSPIGGRPTPNRAGAVRLRLITDASQRSYG